MSQDQFSDDPQSFQGHWERLSQVAAKGAEYDFCERRPHPKYLEGTRIDLLDYIHGLNGDTSRIIWLHGTVGVGKDESLKMGGVNCRNSTRGIVLFLLAINFSSVRDDVNSALCETPALLDPDKSLDDQMEALFLQPLRKLHFRLCDCPPPVFAVDALDGCTSETEVTDLISLLGQALCEPDVPMVHILLTSRSKVHVQEAIREGLHP
ncbi:hypothetical protein K503DRAFT_801444 [Rhizopogon vinicolor AM-OR11-026]|uniref:NACHT domain-containing protein n=1 Tax=Rhizopogon vinicolor AM-OR11-026 TaxID=1314800 RepID=A0A1B7MX49_9AGAM|nr:hypothetical protein K503DRAFT_801444 [Rhizopogon vinicolor AM-OR11-026]